MDMDAIAARGETGTRSDGYTHLLWTGGWDSTFRLLQLLLVERLPVVPHYLRDPTRASTETELRAIDEIRKVLLAGFPHTRNLLQPLRVATVEPVSDDATVSIALSQVRKRIYIGSQYAWLAAYCNDNAIDEMELSVHVDDKVHALLEPISEVFWKRGKYRSIRVAPRATGTAEYELFRFYSMPLFEFGKLEMGAEADSRGWGHLMELTWFCHSPSGGKPCGICGPCIYTIQEGLGHRVPPTRRALSFFYRHLALPIRSALRGVRHDAALN